MTAANNLTGKEKRRLAAKACVIRLCAKELEKELESTRTIKKRVKENMDKILELHSKIENFLKSIDY